MALTGGDPHRYDDMIDLPHHVSAVHPPMPLRDRAAQFAPFRALSGYEEDIFEEARLTDSRLELDEDRVQALDARLQVLEEHLSEKPEISVTYFVPDRRKAGGAYRTVTGRVKKIRGAALILPDGETIPIRDIYNLEGELFAAKS